VPLRLASAVAVAALAALLLAAGPASAARRELPQGWLGTNVDGPVLERSGLLAPELRAMTASGVERVRVAAYWRDMQPYRDRASVPLGELGRFRIVDGVPIDFSSFDRVVAAAVERRLRVLPVVLGCPPWAALDPSVLWSPPRRPAEYARFVAALARRYGPGGGFWRERPRLPRLPIRSWQAWNEPNTRFFWSARSWTRRYVSLLRETRRALRRVDRRATLVLGGLVNRSWVALESVYRAGGRRLFDVVAVHPFSRGPGHVVAILRLVRGVMARRGDRQKPIWVTELSWPAAKGRTTLDYGFNVTPTAQGRLLRSTLAQLARQRRRLRIGTVLWYTWLSYDRGPEPFSYAGLRRLDATGRAVDRPAARAFRTFARRHEGCRKSGRADRCT
jgi:hypothetical protein